MDVLDEELEGFQLWELADYLKRFPRDREVRHRSYLDLDYGDLRSREP